MAHKSWLDIMADDSNLSMASITSLTSITSKDPEFDNSKQGVNLLFNKNVQIICDDSKSRKRTFKEMESQQTEYQQIESNKENDKFLPPKAKQRTNVNDENNKIGFGRFLNWANNDNINNNNLNNNKKILKNKLNDNERNICHINNNKNNQNIGSKSNSKLIICASSINQNRARRRKQIRSKKINKDNVLINVENVENVENIKNVKNVENVENIKNIKNVENVENNENDEIKENDKKFNMTKIIEQQEQEKEINEDEDKAEDEDEDDIDIDIDIIDEPTKSLNDENINKIEEKEENIDDDNNDNNDSDDNEEDDDLKINNINTTKQRRITPILENVVFDANLILNKVPILKQKPMNDILNGPIFLNADQFEKLHKKSTINNEENEENKDYDVGDDNNGDNNNNNNGDVWSKNSLINNNDDDKIKNNKSENWANKLFGEKIRENKKLKEKEEEIMINERKKEIKHEIKIESLLPHSTKCVMFSRESSVSINTDISSPTTTTTTTISSNKPSLEATEWREKQILIGKNTIGYKNFIKKYPNKEIKYRISNKFLSTPDSKDKVGKKRWVGKYQKWRKFLHFFDDDGDDNDDNDDNDDVENKTNDDK